MTTRWIAQRELLIQKDGQGVTIFVRIAAPTQIAAIEFECTFQLEGEGIQIEQSVFGIDGIQAMQLASVMIGSTVDALGESCSWLEQDGYSGFPASVDDPVGGRRNK